jgi:hypothetical protein
VCESQHPPQHWDTDWWIPVETAALGLGASGQTGWLNGLESDVGLGESATRGLGSQAHGGTLMRRIHSSALTMGGQEELRQVSFISLPTPCTLRSMLIVFFLCAWHSPVSQHGVSSSVLRQRSPAVHCAHKGQRTPGHDFPPPEDTGGDRLWLKPSPPESPKPFLIPQQSKDHTEK